MGGTGPQRFFNHPAGVAASRHSVLLAVAGNWDALHPQAQSLLGAVFHSVADLGATAGSAFTGLVTALTALGITTADPHGGFGISNDAWTALTTDAAGFLTPRLKTALTQSLAGFSASSDGTYAISLAAAPFQVYIRNDTAGIRTGAPFAFGGSGSLNVDAGLAISTLTPSFNLAFSFGAATLTYSAGRLTLAAPPWLDSLSLFPVPSAADLSSRVQPCSASHPAFERRRRAYRRRSWPHVQRRRHRRFSGEPWQEPFVVVCG